MLALMNLENRGDGLWLCFDVANCPIWKEMIPVIRRWEV